MKIYYVWVGRNATTGQPHDRTGRMNRYGDLLAFSSMENRNLYFERFYNDNPLIFAVATNGQEAKRKYCAGMTQSNFDEYLRTVNLDIDDLINPAD